MAEQLELFPELVTPKLRLQQAIASDRARRKTENEKLHLLERNGACETDMILAIGAMRD